MNLSNFLSENTEVVVPILYIIGIFIKKTDKIPDYIIPFILIVIGILLCFSILGFSPEAVIQGIFTAGSAVLINQCKKQVTKEFYLEISDSNDGE